MNILCIYHKNCADGFGAALAVKKYADINKFQCEFIPAHYGDTPPDVSGKDVFIVDFSYPRETLLELKEKAKSIKVIDHHKTAQKDLQDLDFCVFDMNYSGAVLTWETIFCTGRVPLLFKYIQDRDLWRWDMENSKAVSAGLQQLKQEFHLWERYLIAGNIPELIETGNIILEYQNKQIEKIINSEVQLTNIAGHNVPCINTTTLISEIGNELAKGQPFCAMYFETADKRIYSLRSDSNGIDVSEIAKKFGGGGHFHAAGFSVDKPPVNLSI